MGRATKPDTIRQAEPLRELTEAQELAIGALIAGQSDADAGQAAGVTRQTVNGWKNHDSTFAAELNRRRRQLWDDSSDRLRALVGDAIDCLASGLDDAEPKVRMAAAVHVLRCVGVYGADMTPTGPVTAQLIESEWRQQTMTPMEKMLSFGV